MPVRGRRNFLPTLHIPLFGLGKRRVTLTGDVPLPGPVQDGRATVLPSHLRVLVVGRPRFPSARCGVERIPRIARETLVELGRHRRSKTGRTHVPAQQGQRPAASSALMFGRRFVWIIGLAAKRIEIWHGQLARAMSNPASVARVASGRRRLRVSGCGGAAELIFRTCARLVPRRATQASRADDRLRGVQKAVHF